MKPLLGLGLALPLILAACAKEIGKDPAKLLDELGLGDGGAALLDGGSASGMDGGSSGGPFGNPNRDVLANIPDAAVASDAVDAFFINDPPPPYCGPDGMRVEAENPGGTPDCPDDKNREGCPCPEEGMEADCWPGERKHRNRGVCQDGRTTCRQSDEFGLRWGPCEGYRLPQEDVLSGPAACGCFSDGTWVLDNLVPCITNDGDHVYSSVLQDDGTADCGSNVGDPPDPPAEDWARTTLNVDCAGQFRLCFTIKAGDVHDPRESDCTIMSQCVDLWYEEAGVTQDAPSLGPWVSSDSACAQRFANGGETHGYGEMTVFGTSEECSPIDDGDGNPYVFHRTRYCPPSCKMRPNDPDCRDCRTGGSGDF